MTLFAYSSLARGFFSGKISSSEPDKAESILDEFAVKGYCYPENFERLRKVEILAKEKQCSVPQIALAWALAQPLNTVLLASARSADRMRDNLKAFDICLTQEELLWLDTI